MNQEDRKVLEERNAVFSSVCILGGCRKAEIVAETVSGFHPDTCEVEERDSFRACVEDIMGFSVTGPPFEFLDVACVFLGGYIVGRMDGVKSLKMYSERADDNNTKG